MANETLRVGSAAIYRNALGARSLCVIEGETEKDGRKVYLTGERWGYADQFAPVPNDPERIAGADLWHKAG
jgi:hypothetical protein